MHVVGAEMCRIWLHLLVKNKDAPHNVSKQAQDSPDTRHFCRQSPLVLYIVSDG